MPIVIKEIIVKTTVESSRRSTTVDEQTLLHIKRMVVSELAERAGSNGDRRKARR